MALISKLFVKSFAKAAYINTAVETDENRWVNEPLK
jgi:hypothetical protein